MQEREEASKPINLHSPTLNTAIWRTHWNWYIKGLPCWAYSRWISRSYTLLFERTAFKYTRIKFNTFCHLKIITQSNDLFAGGKVYFSAEAHLKIRSREKVYTRLIGAKTTKYTSELNDVGKRHGKLASLRGGWRYERVSTGQFWHFIWGKGRPEDPRRDVAWNPCQSSWYGRSTQCPLCQNREGGLDHPETPLVHPLHLLPSPVTPHRAESASWSTATCSSQTRPWADND